MNAGLCAYAPKFLTRFHRRKLHNSHASWKALTQRDESDFLIGFVVAFSGLNWARLMSLRLVVLSAALPCVLFARAADAQVGVSPEAAPVAPETPPTEIPTESAEEPFVDEAIPPETPTDPGAFAANPSRLQAARVAYEGAVVIAQGTEAEPVRFQSSAGQLQAREVRLDTLNRTLQAHGEVRLERTVTLARRTLRAGNLPETRQSQEFVEVAYGQDLNFDFKTGIGQLDNARLVLSRADLSASKLQIEKGTYTARGVILRPGGLTEAERKIYGTPPLNLRAREAQVSPGSAPGQQQVRVSGAGLYFKNTRILPVPSYVFRPGGPGGEAGAPRLTPKISFNSADRIFVATRLSVPLAKAAPERLSAFADIGLSQRVGLRGGVGLESQLPVGEFNLALRRSDVVETQLTNRIELDREPELRFQSPAFGTFALPGKRRAGFNFEGIYGRYNERFIGSGDQIRSDKVGARLVFTTRLQPISGGFFRAFSSYANYGNPRRNAQGVRFDSTYRVNGFEIGYDGALLPRVNGQVSLRLSEENGQTPFRFDDVEIRRELRTTFDIELSPRFLLPVDLRYDLDERRFRDTTFGLLRSYKTFAYGVEFQTARRDLRLEVRQAF